MPTTLIPEEGEDIIYQDQMTEILQNAPTIYDATIKKYFHYQDRTGIYDKNTGKVYMKVKLRLSKPLSNKHEARGYATPIFKQWARPGDHTIFHSDVQQMNQYKIGFFTNICKWSNYNELRTDFVH